MSLLRVTLMSWKCSEKYIKAYIFFFIIQWIELKFENVKYISIYLTNIMVFCFVQNFFFRVRILFFFFSRKARIFFPEFNIRLYDKNSESDYFFFLHQNQNIFFSNIGTPNIFLEKKHNPPPPPPPPFKWNGRSLSIYLKNI